MPERYRTWCHAVLLIDSYDRILAFVGKHLSDPFYLEGTNRMSLRDTIFREVASNILIHREYINAFPAKLIIERSQVKTENASKPHGFGFLQPETFTPFPKNPVIAGFFRQIGRLKHTLNLADFAKKTTSATATINRRSSG